MSNSNIRYQVYDDVDDYAVDEFDSFEEAVECAKEINRDLRDYSEPGSITIRASVPLKRLYISGHWYHPRPANLQSVLLMGATA